MKYAMHLEQTLTHGRTQEILIIFVIAFEYFLDVAHIETWHGDNRRENNELEKDHTVFFFLSVLTVPK